MRQIGKCLSAPLAGAVALMGIAALPTNASAGNGGSIALGALGGFAAGSIREAPSPGRATTPHHLHRSTVIARTTPPTNACSAACGVLTAGIGSASAEPPTWQTIAQLEPSLAGYVNHPSTPTLQKAGPHRTSGPLSKSNASRAIFELPVQGECTWRFSPCSSRPDPLRQSAVLSFRTL